jgi:hypothetical protein
MDKMTAQEFVDYKGEKPSLGKPRKKSQNIESKTQIACVSWFDSQFPPIKNMLFAIPNGGKRGVVTASIMKAEGVRRGSPDLFLSIPKLNYHGMYIEMKTEDGKLKPEQQQFRDVVVSFNYHHVVCRSVDDFVREVSRYLQSFKEPWKSQS